LLHIPEDGTLCIADVSEILLSSVSTIEAVLSPKQRNMPSVMPFGRCEGLKCSVQLFFCSTLTSGFGAMLLQSFKHCRMLSTESLADSVSVQGSVRIPADWLLNRKRCTLRQFHVLWNCLDTVAPLVSCSTNPGSISRPSGSLLSQMRQPDLSYVSDIMI
jgi:hypothetical protein